MSIECYKCNKCGNVTEVQRKICPKCGGSEISLIESDGKGHVIDSTIVYFPPDNYKDLAPYTSVLVQLNNGCNLFGIIKGELEELSPGSPVAMEMRDEARGGIIFRLESD